MVELRDEELNVKKTTVVIDTTFAIAKRTPKTIQACTGFELLTAAIPVQGSTQMS